MPEVVCLGILVADVVGKPVDRWPDRGKLELVERMELHIGGCAANTAVALAKVGVPTGLIGKVGSDGFGDFIVQAVGRHGVDCSGLVRDKNEATSATMVTVSSDGERSFIHYIGANAVLTEEDVDFGFVNSARILHVAGSLLMPGIDGEPTARILKRAREAGLTTTLDTAWDSKGRWMTVMRPCLEYVDYFLPSFEEAKMLTGKQAPEDVAKVLLDAGVKTVGLKMGEDGCYIRNAEVEIRIPRFDVDAVDATGAGDAFVAGFLTGLVHGWDMEKTGRFANAVGALCVTQLGAAAGIRSLDETLRFMGCV
ncbi:MAG: sugar kinase [Armatimonadetes bacterium]|nr:sugar kinase [Armatimonadota bacterium]